MCILKLHKSLIHHKTNAIPDTDSQIRQNTPETKTTVLGAFKLREEKKETGVGSWFAKKKSEDSG